MSEPQPPSQTPPGAPVWSAGPAAPPYGAPQAPYLAPQDPRFAQLVQPPAPRRSAMLGRLALALALLATVGASTALAVALGAIGAGVGPQLQNVSPSSGLEVLTPVRGWVLVAEVAGWTGTVLGIWALVQGIVAAARDSGRGAGIAAIVIAALGPIVAAVASLIAVTAGIAGSGAV
ncbi:hypothetical protein [Microbacterium marinilacus]|uniref:Yip1 domain-containing protein n=1 Tax=Microbacterium marinilacus TaxID=415209 RepID=A0ABP7B7B8_9MICO|nr:hypothetical protein [Microbacterium marinilacus]MBY0687397.1 hypothetical protein [Microbacterium marinilacus]